MVSGEDLLGDGVNLAARIQQAAKPDAICISQILFDQIRRHSPFAFEDDVLAIQTRSILQILGAMAGFVDVPESMSSQAFEGYSVPSGKQAPFFVHSGQDKPEISFASTLYNGYWYWIEPTDLRSKQVFTLMLFLTTLTDTGAEDNIPVLTIPTG